MIHFQRDDIEAARKGNRAALEALVRAAQRPVYNLAIRMLANPEDAKDATQEILIKFVTHLGTVRDIEATGGWVMRIACRHLINQSKLSQVEKLRFDFDKFASDLEEGLSELSVEERDRVETLSAIEQVKTNCTLAMLTCLSRPLRIAYILGDIFELSDDEASSVLEIAAATYRQRLKRSRDSVKKFVVAACGNASESATCRCEKRVIPAIASGRISPAHVNRPALPDPHLQVLTLRPYVQNLEEGRRATAIFRSNPDFKTNVSDLLFNAIEPILGKLASNSANNFH